MFSPEVTLRIEAAKIVATAWDAMVLGSNAEGGPTKNRRQLYAAINDMARFLETGEAQAAPVSAQAA